MKLTLLSATSAFRILSLSCTQFRTYQHKKYLTFWDLPPLMHWGVGCCQMVDIFLLSFVVREVELKFSKGNISRARIFKRLRSPGIDSKESIPPAYLAWRANTSRRVSYRLTRLGIDSWVKNLSPAMGRGIDSRNRVWNWVAKLRRLAGNHMPS